MSEITYKTVLEALLPPGSLWRPKKTISTEGEIGIELVTNGTFDTDLSGWTDNSTGTGAIAWDAPGDMRLLPGGSGIARADQQIAATVPNALYELKFDVLAGSVAGGKVEIGTTEGSDNLLSVTITGVGSYAQNFTATGAMTWVGVEFEPPEVSMYIDNISIKALTGGAVIEGGGLNQLLIGIADNHTVVWEVLKTLAHIRDPRATAILDDLEREYGIYPNLALSEQVRRDKLAAVKYARVGTGSKDNLQNALHNAGFTDLYVWENSPAQDPSIFFVISIVQCDEPLAQCGEPDAQCQSFEGELIVNGDIFNFTVDYLAACGETLAQCDEPTATAGNFTGESRVKIEYPMPTDSAAWPFVFFVGGEATFNPTTGPSIECGEPLGQCDEPSAFCQWFDGQLKSIEFVDVPCCRIPDLKRLILQIKPIHSWCALLVNPV